MDENGTLQNEVSAVQQAFIDYYSNSLVRAIGTRGVVRQKIMEIGVLLSLEQQTALLKPFSAEDVRIAMFNIDSAKSPGSDGFGSGFFEEMWPIIRAEISSAVLQFFLVGRMPSQMPHTLLTLLPKMDQPRQAKNFRSIDCCQTLYKVVSKMLCYRLAKVLPFIIGKQQGAFVQGRSILHNVLIGQDLLRGYNRTRISPR